MLPFLPQKACMGRKCCQQRGLLRAFGEKGTHTARFLPDGPQVRRNARKGCEVLWGGAVGDAAGESNTAGSGADGMGMAGATERRRDTGGCGAGTTLAGMAVWGRDAGGIGGDRKLARHRLGAADGSAGGLSATLAGATGAMEAGDGWPRGVGARSAQYASAGGGYSPKLASIAATRSSSAPMSCWFTSSIFCKSAGEAFST